LAQAKENAENAKSRKKRELVRAVAIVPVIIPAFVLTVLDPASQYPGFQIRACLRSLRFFALFAYCFVSNIPGRAE
jgi:hypothetical protein